MKSLALRSFAFLPLALLIGPSCALVFDLSKDQCSTNSDCARLGADLVCNSGICESSNPGSGGSGAKGGNGGTGARGGSSASGGMSAQGGTSGTLGGDGGTGEVGGTGATSSGGTGGTSKGGTGGTSKGGTGGTSQGGSTSNAGMGGEITEPECDQHADCFALYPEDKSTEPRACVEGQCIPIKSKECPVILPTYMNSNWSVLKKPDNAIILGAMAPLNGTALETISRNYDMAATELSQTIQGVYGNSSKRHELVFVVCQDLFLDNPPDILKPVNHLIKDLKVPAIISTLRLQDQKYVWDSAAKGTDTLMMMPLYSDQSLINEQDDGLIWHMLAGADALSVTYQPLFDQIVAHLKLHGTLGDTEEVKVAHLKAIDEPFLANTATFVEQNLMFNGQNCSDNFDDGLYDPIVTTSWYLDSTNEQTEAVESILSFCPHIVIGTSITEVLKWTIPGIEAQWETRCPGMARPFYLLGALTFNDQTGEMTVLLGNDDSPAHSQRPRYERILGVNWPGAPDKKVYDEYLERFRQRYGAKLEGYENFYDATYYIMYGVAAQRGPVTGPSIAKGLLRVTNTAQATPVVEVGPNSDMDKYVTLLSTDSMQKIQLLGAMGPPSWDDDGGRNDPASVWCVNTVGAYAADQMRYVPGDPATLSGAITCFEFNGVPLP